MHCVTAPPSILHHTVPVYWLSVFSVRFFRSLHCHYTHVVRHLFRVMTIVTRRLCTINQLNYLILISALDHAIIIPLLQILLHLSSKTDNTVKFHLAQEKKYHGSPNKTKKSLLGIKLYQQL